MLIRRQDPYLLLVSMAGVKMGDRLVQVGCAHGGRLAALAGKVGLTGRAVNLKPDNKIYFRQLGAVYSKAGKNGKSTEMLMVYMAMNAGKENSAAAAAAKAAKAGSAAASTFASLGPPDKVFDWESDGRKLQTWFYLAKKQAFTFDVAAGMTLVQKSDWSGAAGGKK